MARNDFGEDSPRATYSHSHGIVSDGRRPSRHAPALSLNATLPQTVQATVHQGRIVLTGRVAWLYQREVAEITVAPIGGVVSVTNRIEVETDAASRDVRHRITEALHRMADINAKSVHVEVKGNEVTLTGSVSSWAQRDAAQYAADAAAGIAVVHNQIEVIPTEFDTADTCEIC